MAKLNQIRGAVIGYGGAYNMGRIHAEQMRKAGCEFVAACDPDPSRMAEAERDFPGIRTFQRAEELLEQADIELVTVITPHNLHAPLAKQVLESGKHCIVEKPMCIRAADADELVKLAESGGLMLSVYHNRRWDGWYLTVKDLLARGFLGDIFHIEISLGMFDKPVDTWRSSKAVSGGVFYDWGAHMIDYALGLASGKVASVSGFAHNRVWHEFTNEDQMNSILRFADGAAAHIEYSQIAFAAKPAVRLLGTKGAVLDQSIWDDHLTLHTAINGLKMQTEIKYLPGSHDSYYDNIVGHLLRDEELAVKPEQARRIIDLIETTEKSALAGRELAPQYE